jgi:hypothetical protein
MRLLAVVALILSLAGAAAAAPRLPAAQPGVPNFPKVPGKWSHVDINLTIRRQPHTITLDRGRIIQVSTTQDAPRAGRNPAGHPTDAADARRHPRTAGDHPGPAQEGAGYDDAHRRWACGAHSGDVARLTYAS